MTTGAMGSVLTDDLLARCAERAPKYDEENKFFQEDFDELKAAGYLNIAVPKELGGGGMNLAEVGRETRKLAYYDHATALALNMHIYCAGIAADLWRSGDKSLEWLLKGSIAGEVYAAGHAPSSSLDELVRVTKPGGCIAFSIRVDMTQDGDDFPTKFASLEKAGKWKLAKTTEPYKPLPKGEPDVFHQVWAYEVA